ncbi:MAG: hypothetical protein JO194_01290 [Candidatus Eremiobacteraeota bacterium]|nr:hypothetical protein [Candidatus Eremiobacteraeota bacterium]
MLQWVLVLVAAYLAYRFLGNNWLAAAGVIVVYLLFSTWYRISQERSKRVQGALIVSMPLTDLEKAHMGAISERNERLAQRQSQRK